MELALFKAMHAKMGYLSQRQDVIAQNIANANTPNYQPRDLGEVDFGRGLRKIIEAPRNQIDLASTTKGHIPNQDGLRIADQKEQRQTYDVTLSGNAVVLEEQMVKAGRTKMDYDLMASLYRKQKEMLKMSMQKIS